MIPLPRSSQLRELRNDFVGLFKKLRLSLLNIRDICLIDAPGLVEPLCHLVNIITGVPKERNHFLQLRQIEPDIQSVYRHAAEICLLISRADKRHFLVNESVFLRRDAHRHLHAPPSKLRTHSSASFNFFGAALACELAAAVF